MRETRLTAAERQVYQALRKGHSWVRDIRRNTHGLTDAEIREIRKSLRDKGLAKLSPGANQWTALPPTDGVVDKPVRAYAQLRRLERDFLDLYWLHGWVNRYNASRMLGISLERVCELREGLVRDRFLVLDANGQYRLDDELSDQDREQMRA